MTDLTIMPENYENIRTGIVELLKTAHSAAARTVNSLMTATYWGIGCRIVKFEQGGESRAEYGEQLAVNPSRRSLSWMNSTAVLRKSLRLQQPRASSVA